MTEQSSELHLDPKRAVLLVESKDGSTLVVTMYDPVFVATQNVETFDDRVASTAYVTDSRTAVTYREGKMAVFKVTDNSTEEADKIYAEARKEALLREAEMVPVMATPEDMMALNFRAHRAAIAEVYLAGQTAGAHQVEFRDAHVEKEIDDVRLRAYHDAYNAVNTLVYSRVGTKLEKGLKRARRALSELRRPHMDAFRERWGDR